MSQFWKPGTKAPESMEEIKKKHKKEQKEKKTSHVNSEASNPYLGASTVSSASAPKPQLSASIMNMKFMKRKADVLSSMNKSQDGFFCVSILEYF